jgi:translocation and assembly module TamB
MSQVEIKGPPARARRGRRLLWNAAGLTIALLAVIGALWFWVNSHQFEELVRRRIVSGLETATGGRVEIRSFHWRLIDLEAEAGGVVIHGLEDPADAPYAQVESLRVRISVLGFFSPRIRLRDLDVVKPELHLIYYPNGSTNQPHPRVQKKTTTKPLLETLFDIQAGHVAIEQGMFDLDNRAASFDFADKYLPLDLDANDLSLMLAYNPGEKSNPESYHIDAGLRDLMLQRGGRQSTVPPALHALFQISLDLTRNAAYLRSLRITASSRDIKDRTLEVSGALTDFTHARWQARVAGEFDMRMLNPIMDYPFTPDGVARMDLTGAGDRGEFRLDGPVHVDHGAYVAPGVSVREVQIDTRVHVDPNQMHFGSVTVRFKEGGSISGDLNLDQWLPHVAGRASMEPSEEAPSAPHDSRLKRFFHRQPITPTPPPPPSNPRDIVVKEPAQETTVNGTITSRFENVSLDTVQDIVGHEPFRRLGLGLTLNGPATAKWVKGDVNTLVVAATLDLNPFGQPVPSEESANGALDATYTQHTGAVDIRRFEINLPGSQIQAHGRLGAYPLTSPTNLNLDFQSHNLGDFDTVLRELGLGRNGKSGTAALPVALSGQAEFHGSWAGSLVSPRISGTAKATELSIEFPPKPDDASQTPQFVRWDSIEADGTYDAEHVAIAHGHLKRGEAQINLEGTLSAANANPGAARADEKPAFTADSILQARVHASKVNVSDILLRTGIQATVSGTLNADFQANGPVRMLGGSGWAELDDGNVYGEPVSRIRAEGTIANQIIKLSSVNVRSAAGAISASGAYHLDTRSFQAEAHAAGIDVANIEHVRSTGDALGGTLEFSATASGTPDDPHLEGHATLAGLIVRGEKLGTVDLTAHTVNRDILYDVKTNIETAEISLHGQTELHGSFLSRAKLDFSRFNISAIFKLKHIEGIDADSALSGNITLEGPLTDPAQLRGDARMDGIAVKIAGVQLRNEGSVHATLANQQVSLDPVHITGDQTDLHAQGTLELKDTKRLDLSANGSINLALAETLDKDLTAAGTTTFQLEAHGPLAKPDLRGTVRFENGSLSLEDLPNGLSQLQGTLEFNQNRLEVRKLTAMTGGGQLSMDGYLSYQQGIFADLSVTGKSIRIRYPQGVSSLADTTLHLQGSQNSLLLSGNVLLTRFSISPDLDIAALAAQANTAQPIAAPDAPSNHIRLDIRIRSSPQLSFQNAFAKLAGDIDLHLRGTVASPSLLGRVSVTEGSATIAGTHYELQRGDLQFTNPVRIQPNIDLNATARVQDYDITLGLHGTPDKLNVSYRSDPPLPQSDVVALLALGRTQSEQGIYTQQQEQAATSPSTDVLLGGALNATVSNRVQKLFGAGSVKVDPNYIGSLGNSTTRITVDEQVGKRITLTYATNVDTSAQQFLQAEIAINRHVSLLVTRDESGVFSMVVKATRRYK